MQDNSSHLNSPTIEL